ncbi:MAG: LptF/LptG family permease [Cytophagales bacterium]|nr:LptF/LptG family permease [Armatimonadota bacterium]
MRIRLADRYIFGEMILPFVIGTLAVLMMLVGNTLFGLLETLLRDKWPLAQVVRVLVLNIPTVLVLTIPVSTALAASLATNRMTRDNEITVFRSAGVPLLRIFLPIIAFGILMSAANLWISDRVVPWAWREQQNVQSYLDNLPSNPVDAGLTIPVENFDITFGSAQKLSDTKRRLNQVVIVDKGVSGDEYRTIITAKTADYENGVWQMRDIVRHQYDKKGFTVFDAAAPTLTMNLRIDFSQAYSNMTSGQADKMSFAELSERTVAAKRQGQLRAAIEFDVARWFKLSLPMMGVVFALCGPPLALRFSRAGSFTGVLLSIITVFVAWNTLLLMKAIGLGGYLPAPVAAWSTNLLFTGIGLWLLKTQE